ncbi:hypothetical protein LCGC14_2040560 [marine sediment metagenome]|uniref:Amidohydrolase-related domain-containing protein n=1 Tax=marine sediment metagenome TaxID=412755 RepID=A0A0F9FEM3_9ZZZZ
MLDGHIHMRLGVEDRDEFLRRLEAGGFAGGVVISNVPSNCYGPDGPNTPMKRLDKLLAWTHGQPELFPLYWIDPMSEDALAQVATAVERGVIGFKVICMKFAIREPRAMDVFRAIAEAGKPILFHSGILWDNGDSSRYNRPGEFEPLLSIEGIRFALAHVSWPWCDECIAVFGKVLATSPNVNMYIDLTPGTPPIYRKEVLTKLFTVGYDVAENLIFGTDGSTDNYNAPWAREWIERDRQIYAELGLDEQTVGDVFGENLRRFLGISDAPAHERKRPKVGE